MTRRFTLFRLLILFFTLSNIAHTSLIPFNISMDIDDNPRYRQYRGIDKRGITNTFIYNVVERGGCSASQITRIQTAVSEARTLANAAITALGSDLVLDAFSWYRWFGSCMYKLFSN